MEGTRLDLNLTDMDLEGLEAEAVLKWTIERFGERAALASSFSAEDMVLIHMLSLIRPGARVFTLDTGRLNQETYDLMEKIMERYDISLKVYCPEAGPLEEMIERYGPNLFYKNLNARRLCCQVRKVEPLNRALSELDAWICGLMRCQSVTRLNLKKVEVDTRHNGILKINPLADWNYENVWSYINSHDIPYNALYDRGYASIGCEPCTRSVKKWEDVRLGRWWWESPEDKECGLHPGDSCTRESAETCIFRTRDGEKPG